MSWLKRPKQRPETERTAAHLRAGAVAEQLAEAYLHRHGLRCLHRNYRCCGGELDRVMSAGSTLVFVEVRHRRSGNYGGAAASVTLSKQQRLLRAASEYLLRERIDPLRPCRFDVIAVEGDLSQAKIHWIPNAFDLDRTGA